MSVTHGYSSKFKVVEGLIDIWLFLPAWYLLVIGLEMY